MIEAHERPALLARFRRALATVKSWRAVMETQPVLLGAKDHRLYDELSLDDRLAVAETMAALKSARQIAYQGKKKVPALAVFFEVSDLHYQAICRTYGFDPQPVFDVDAYVAERKASGDVLYADRSDSEGQ